MNWQEACTNSNLQDFMALHPHLRRTLYFEKGARAF